MTLLFSLPQGFTLAENFSFKRDSTVNTAERMKKAFKRFGTLLQFIDTPIDPQDIFDGSIPFNNLVLKPQSATFGTPLETLTFFDQNTSKAVLVIFTDTGMHVCVLHVEQRIF